MTIIALDTHAIVKELREAGFDEQQAEALTRIVRRSQDADVSSLATRGDLREAELRLETRIETVKADILKWMFGTIGFQTLIILAAVITLAKMAHS